MKTLILIGALTIAMMSGCSSSKSDSTPAPAPSGGSEPLALDASTSTGEDINLLKEMISSEVEAGGAGLKQASALEVRAYDRGIEASLQECQSLQRSISANYPLSTYEEESDKPALKGIKICPDEGSTTSIEFGAYLNRKSARFFISGKRQINSAGVMAAKVLTISYNLMFDSVKVERQYLLNNSSKIVEFVETRQEKGKLFYTTVGSQDEKGNILRRLEKIWPKQDEPYLWRGVETFVKADGTVTAMRVHRNDGKGIEAQVENYFTPRNVTIDAVEVSPLDSDAKLKIDGQTTTWPKSQAGLQLFSKGGQSCGNGYIGWNSSGGAIRNFGDIRCDRLFDVQTMIR